MQAVVSDFLAIDRKRRVYLPFYDAPLRPPEERVRDFDEIYFRLDEEIAQFEASRCIHCPDPAPCMLACPVHNDIPSAMWLIEEGKFIEAARLYRETSSLPEICSRVCPHNQLCQGSCVRNKNGEPVQTGMLEQFAVDYQRAHEDLQTYYQAPPTGKKVAVVGAGPAGLACADLLLQKGHSVTVFDAKPAPGGLLLYGIPNFKLEKSVVSARVNDLLAAGMKFVGNTFIGKDKTVDDLFEEGFAAVFIGVGTGIDAPMKIPGEDLPGVFKGTEFLIRANVAQGLLPEDMKERPEIGKRVVVIGGGDTASDCLRTALRMGAETVTCLYRRTENEMPGNSKDRKLARQEGATYQFLTQPIRFIANEEGHLAVVECVRMELGEPDESGRRRPIPVDGSNFTVEAEMAALALGYWPDPTIGESTPDLETRKYGLVVADPETGATTRPGVYAGGDAVTGPDLVVTAMLAGRKAALAIDRDLQTTA